MTPSPSGPRRPVRRGPLLVLALVALLTSLVAGAAVQPAQAATDPRLSRSFYVDPGTQAAAAARTDPTFRGIAATAQSRWLTTADNLLQVRSTVASYVSAAAKANQTLVLTLYAVPFRDCLNHSSGGFTPVDYRLWVRQIVAGLAGAKAMIVLEPDSLGMLGDCPQPDRTTLLAYAAKILSDGGAWVYMDGANSSWETVATMRDRLLSAGVKDAKGFFTNVSNFRTTTAEKAYGIQLRKALAAAGAGTKSFVIDTSRNGAGPAPDNDWCNPPEARLGAKPAVVNDGTGLDATLWIKPPGESDGFCNDGPAAGQFWPLGTRRLLGLA